MCTVDYLVYSFIVGGRTDTAIIFDFFYKYDSSTLHYLGVFFFGLEFKSHIQRIWVREI